MSEGVRARRRDDVTRRVLETGRRHLAEYGAAALSLRAVTRDLGMVSSAVYRYVASRDELLTLLVVSIVIFVLTQILPGDTATSVLGQNATPETLAAFRHELGLDRPAALRYLAWLGGVLHGDFGVALTNKQDIVEVLGPRFRNTLFLAGYAALMALPLAHGAQR